MNIWKDLEFLEANKKKQWIKRANRKKMIHSGEEGSLQMLRYLPHGYIGQTNKFATYYVMT